MPITCLKCDYDLTGTPRAGRCPECGLSAEASYHEAENPRRHRPLHPIAVSTLVICAIGLVMSLMPIAAAEIVDSFVGVILLWNASPFIAVGAMASFWDSRRYQAITFLVASVVLLAWCGFYLADFHRSSSSTAGLIFLFAPLYSWMWVAAVVIFLSVGGLIGKLREVN